MRVWLPLVGACALAGCAQILGIDKTELAPDGTPPPGSVLLVDRVSIGTEVLAGSQDVSALPPAVFFDDTGAGITGTAVGNGWVAKDPTQSVELFLPDTVPRVVALPTDRLIVGFDQLEHPNPQPAGANASFQLAVTLDAAVAAGESFQMFTVGAWSQVPIGPAVGDTALAQSIPSGSLGVINGRGIDAITPADTLAVLRYTGDQLTGVALAPPFAEVDGINTITATMAPTGTESTLDATFPAMEAANRLAATTPVGGTPSFGFALNAAPGGQLANMSGIQLRNQGVDPLAPSVTLPFGNPFSATFGWKSTLLFAATAVRAFTPATGANAGIPTTLASQLFAIVDAEQGGPIGPQLAAGLPTSITLGGTPLMTDGLSVGIDPTAPQAVTFTADITANTLYQVVVLELVPNATSTTLVETVRFVGTAAAPAITIPAGIFVSGHDYVIRAQCVQGGFPGLADGNLAVRDLPFAIGLLDSGAFQIP